MAQPLFPEALLTGFGRIDDQHRFLFSLVADMARESCGPRSGNVPLRLATLASYADVHFREEEGLMESSGYPDLEAHRREHRALTSWLEAFGAEHEAGRASFPDLVQRMQSWLADHIQSCDVRLAAYLNQAET